jgi:hypothetical protein
MFKVLALLGLFVATITGTGITNAAAAPLRAIYWNCVSENQGLGHDCATRAPDVVKMLKADHVDEVHIWLNGNQADHDCAETFWKALDTSYSPDSLRAFAGALQRAGFRIVFTLTPRVEGKPFLDSLIGPDSPAAIARELGGIPLELDMEGTWQAISGTDCLDPTKADAMLIDGLRKASPHSKLIVSFTGTSVLIRHKAFADAADILSPQLYETHFGRARDLALLARVLKNYSQPLEPALSVECNVYYTTTDKVGCSEDQMKAALATASSEVPAQRYVGPVFWAAYESMPCGKEIGQAAVCSTYGDAFLKE